MKICSCCREELNETSFGKLKRNKDGLRSVCKECRKIKDAKYKEKADAYVKRWRLENKELKTKLDREYYLANKEKLTAYARKWRLENKELNYKIIKDWGEKNKDHIREYKRQWNRNKLKNNETYYVHSRFASLMRNHMSKYIKEGKGNSSWVNFVDYDADELLEHLGDNLLKKGFQIDHIIPVSAYSFNSYGDSEFKKCWSLRNLRVISSSENNKKSNYIDKKLIEEYNIEDLMPTN